MRHQVWELFNEERQRLQVRLAEQIRTQMSLLLSDASETADIFLVAADGRKLAAHACILRQRAPIFFQRYVEPTLNATPRNGVVSAQRATSAASGALVEVAVGDVDLTGLAFFIRSIYTSEEIRQLGELDQTLAESIETNPRNDEEDPGSWPGPSDREAAGSTLQNNSNHASDNATNSGTDDYGSRTGGMNGYDSSSHTGARDSTEMSSPDSLSAAEISNTSMCQAHLLVSGQNPNRFEPKPSILGTNRRGLVGPISSSHSTPCRMSTSYSSPSNRSGASANRLFGDTLLKSPEKYATLGYGGIDSLLIDGTGSGLVNAPSMTSFRELAVSRSGNVSALSSRCGSVQQLPLTPSCMESNTNSWSIRTNGSPIHQPTARRANGGLQHSNKIFPMFINFQPGSMGCSQPSAVLDEVQYRASLAAVGASAGNSFMSRSYPQPQPHLRPLYDSPRRRGYRAEDYGSFGLDGDAYDTLQGTATARAFDYGSAADSGVHSASLNSSQIASEGEGPPTGGSQNYGSFESASTLGTLRSRTLRAQRLSVTSLTSLTSIDLTPSMEGSLPLGDRNAASQLAADLLEMYRNARDSDVTVTSDDGGEFAAHRCILWAAGGAFFRRQLRDENTRDNYRIHLRGFSKASIHFLLSFLYGGLTCLPSDEEDLDVWEIVALAVHLNLDKLTDVAILHIRAYKCHFFHKPCAACVSAIFDALSQFSTIKCLNGLYEEALDWQARHFARIWKGRVFTHLDAHWQNACLQALLDRLNEERVLDVLLSCERLQLSLPRMKQVANVLARMVANIAEYCTDFLIGSFHKLIASRAYRSHGMGLALNLSFMENVLPSLIHNLSADVAVRTFISLRDLIVHIQECTAAAAAAAGATTTLGQPTLRAQLSGSSWSLSSNSPGGGDDWNPRFLQLNRRLFQLTDRHLLHYAASVVKCQAWELLSAQERNRIQEVGIFAEMEMPRAPPPRFSSLNRSYHGPSGRDDALGGINPVAGGSSRSPRHAARHGACRRSVSAGVSHPDDYGYYYGSNELADMVGERTRSLERGVVEFDEILARRGALEKIVEIHTAQGSSNLPGDSDSDWMCGSQTLPHGSSAKTTRAHGGSLKSGKTPQKRNLTQIIQDKTNQAFVPSKIPTSAQKSDSVTILGSAENPEPESQENSEPKKPSTMDPSSELDKEEEILLQRQNTHTVMTVEQNRKAGIDPRQMGVPQAPSDSKGSSGGAQPGGLTGRSATNQKPRSVVRPMPKNPPLAVAGTVSIGVPLGDRAIGKISPEPGRRKSSTTKESIKNLSDSFKSPLESVAQKSRKILNSPCKSIRSEVGGEKRDYNTDSSPAKAKDTQIGVPKGRSALPRLAPNVKVQKRNPAKAENAMLDQHRRDTDTMAAQDSSAGPTTTKSVARYLRTTLSLHARQNVAPRRFAGAPASAAQK